MKAAVLGVDAIRKSEDALVDVLIEAAPAYGAVSLAATFARAYVDVNREPFELDQDMFADKLPAYASMRTARVAAGLGSIAKVVAEGQEIYREKLFFAEARARIEAVHRPYHAALQRLLDEAKTSYGFAILLDWHSMPSASSAPLSGPDIVLGDRFGSSCAPFLTQIVEAHFSGEGYRVARNAPYAGGFTTEFYGRPGSGVHVLQIELNRCLYIDEVMLEPTDGFGPLASSIEKLFEALQNADWSALISKPVREGSRGLF